VAQWTSWRWEPGGKLVLTSLGYSEDSNCLKLEPQVLPWSGLAPPPATDPLHPRPTAIGHEDVLAHGVRHISFLVRHAQDNRIRDTLSERSRSFFAGLSGQLAGKYRGSSEVEPPSVER